MFKSHLLITILLTYAASALSSTNTTSTLEEIPESYVNLSLAEGNSLWTQLIKDCKKPTLTCVQNNIYSYLKTTLNYPKDVQFTSFMKFAANKVDYESISKNESREENEEYERSDFEESTPFEDMTRSLKDNTMKFLMTHDLELQLPETVFEGTVLKLSPRSFEGNGALVKVEFLPRQLESGSDARLFKKLRKFITERLVFALLAVLLVIKLLAVKFLFVLPMVMGVAAAKKLLLKLLLFVFPALHHVFKLCAYVPHGTKFHHHKHHINHIHHVAGHHGHHHHKPHGHYEVIAPHSAGPPKLDLADHHHGVFHGGHEDELQYYQGPHGSDFLSHRQDENDINPWGQGHDTRRTKPGDDDGPLTPSEIEAMVLKAEKEALIKQRLQQEKLRIQQENIRLQEQLNKAINLQEKLKYQAALVGSKLPVNVPPPISPNVIRPPSYYLQTPNQSGPSAVQRTPSTSNVQVDKISITYQDPTQIVDPQSQQQALIKQQQMNLANHKKIIAQALTKEPPLKYPQPTIESRKSEVSVPVSTTTPSPQKKFEEEILNAAEITYDPFYSPILVKIDKIMVGLGFKDEPCRERLICSMYKNPAKFSPHSNLLSAELSRDSSELQKPTKTNAAVVRFYKYVQAARDGQDKRNCLRLYASCMVNTEL